MRFSWNCIRTADAVRKGVHTHAGTINFGTPSAGTVTSRIANTTLPAPGIELDGDFCDALQAIAGQPSTADTVGGRFERSGIYDIYVLAADPAHPSTSGKITIYVTDPEDRPDPIFRADWEGTFQGGRSGAVQGVTGQVAPEELFDLYTSSFSIPLNAMGGWVNLTYDEENPANVISFRVLQGENPITNGGGETGNTPGGDRLETHKEVDETDYQHSITYTVEVQLDRGADADFKLDVVLFLDMDPGKVY
jgi:hypothetical protein